MAVASPHEPAGKLAPAVRRFIAHLESSGYSKETIRYYRPTLAAFSLAVDKEPGDVTDEDIEDYLLVNLAHLKPSTRRTYLNVFRAFFAHLHKRKKIAHNPAEVLPYPKLAKKRPTYYLPDEVARLINVDRSPRDRVLLTVLARHGQRISSVRRLRWSDVDFRAACIRYQSHKGGEPITLPLDLDTARRLKAWRVNLPDDAEWVFPGRRGPLSYDAASEVVLQACKQAGVPYRGAHEFRRTLITTLLQMGEPLHVVSQKVAGHSDVSTTIRHYAGADDDDVAGAIRRLPF